MMEAERTADDLAVDDEERGDANPSCFEVIDRGHHEVVTSGRDLVAEQPDRFDVERLGGPREHRRDRAIAAASAVVTHAASSAAGRSGAPNVDERAMVEVALGEICVVAGVDQQLRLGGLILVLGVEALDVPAAANDGLERRDEELVLGRVVSATHRRADEDAGVAGRRRPRRHGLGPQDGSSDLAHAALRHRDRRDRQVADQARHLPEEGHGLVAACGRGADDLAGGAPGNADEGFDRPMWVDGMAQAPPDPVEGTGCRPGGAAGDRATLRGAGQAARPTPGRKVGHSASSTPRTSATVRRSSTCSGSSSIGLIVR